MREFPSPIVINTKENIRPIRPTRHTGGLHAAPIGVSTQDKPDTVRDREALEEFNRELQKTIDAVDWSQTF